MVKSILFAGIMVVNGLVMAVPPGLSSGVDGAVSSPVGDIKTHGLKADPADRVGCCPATEQDVERTATPSR